MARASMSRMHFVDLAKGLRSVMPALGINCSDRDDFESQAIMWQACVRQVALTCRSFNEAFDSAKFYEACGYE